jgi:lysophospholipase L1-like esterase
MTRCERAAWLVVVVCAGCGNDPANPGLTGAGASGSAEGGSSGRGGSGGSALGGGSSQAGSAPAAPSVRWVGRVDAGTRAAPRFAWSGSGFVATVSGTAISLKLKSEGTSDPVFFQPVIDGTPGARFSVPSGERTIALGSGLRDGDHTVELYRETEGKYGHSVFEGFTEGTLKAPQAGPDRLIEIVGDSISAGFGNLGSEEHPNYGSDPNGGCTFTTETESAYNTYGAIAARRLDADASIVAVSGWGAYRDNSNDTAAVLSSVYENALGLVASPAWSFGRKADVVVINLGTNDFATGDPGETEFKTAYSSLIASIRGNYPDAWIFCMLGPMLFGDGLTQATAYTTAIVSEHNTAGDSRVGLLNFGTQDTSLGTGCAYHPNVTVQTAMADQLVSAIEAALDW